MKNEKKYHFQLFIHVIIMFVYFSAMRQMYFQQGGSDPAILAQIADMEREARTLDNKGVKARRKRGRYSELIKSHVSSHNSHIIPRFY